MPKFRPEDGKHWILWDGDCGFCRRCLVWVRKRDWRGEFRDFPYQEAPSPPMTPELAEACRHAVHVMTAEGEIIRAGRAVLFILARIGWGWIARWLCYPPFIWGVEAIYALVARNRAFFSRFLFRSEQ